MRKLVESTFITLDGVISDPQVWGPPYWDDEHTGYARELLFAADSLLLGRKTYEGFAATWPSRSGDEYTDRINAMPKHVASRTLRAAEWNAEILDGDAAEAVGRLKEGPGASILKFGTGELDRALLERGLVDELHLWVFPVVAGSGDRLLDGLNPIHFGLRKSVALRSGIVIHVCTPT